MTNNRQWCSNLVICATALAAIFACTAGAADPPASQPVTSVRLVVDYDDGAQKVLTRLAWKEGMTVEDVLKAAHAAPHGITLESRGEKDTFFVVKIDDLANKSDPERKRHWQYWVNDKYATVSAGVQRVNAGDAVVWKFAAYPPGD